MKKRALLAAGIIAAGIIAAGIMTAGIMAVALLAGCGDTGTGKDTAKTAEHDVDIVSGTAVSTDDEDYSLYVKLGEYKGIELTKRSSVVSDEAIQDKINSDLVETAIKEKITSGAVKDGDTINIDYEGKMDGESFDGGKSTDVELTIGSGNFIEGFEDGLIGTKVGKTVDLELTFPEDYETASLAGHDVSFTVTVNYIVGNTTIPQFNDAWVKENSQAGSKTVKEYRKETKQLLKESLEKYNQSLLEKEILTTVIGNSEIGGFPEEKLQQYKDQLNKNLDYTVETYGVDKETYLKNYCGMTLEEYEEYQNQFAKDMVAEEMIVTLIADAENITCTEEEIKESTEKTAKDYGFESAEEFEKKGGKDTVRNGIIKGLEYEKVIQLITDNAKFVDNVNVSGNGK